MPQLGNTASQAIHSLACYPIYRTLNVSCPQPLVVSVCWSGAATILGMHLCLIPMASREEKALPCSSIAWVTTGQSQSGPRHKEDAGLCVISMSAVISLLQI